MYYSIYVKLKTKQTKQPSGSAIGSSDFQLTDFVRAPAVQHHGVYTDGFFMNKAKWIFFKDLA